MSTKTKERVQVLDEVKEPSNMQEPEEGWRIKGKNVSFKDIPPQRLKSILEECVHKLDMYEKKVLYFDFKVQQILKAAKSRRIKVEGIVPDHMV